MNRRMFAVGAASLLVAPTAALSVQPTEIKVRTIWTSGGAHPYAAPRGADPDLYALHGFRERGMMDDGEIDVIIRKLRANRFSKFDFEDGTHVGGMYSGSGSAMQVHYDMVAFVSRWKHGSPRDTTMVTAPKPGGARACYGRATVCTNPWIARIKGEKLPCVPRVDLLGKEIPCV